MKTTLGEMVWAFVLGFFSVLLGWSLSGLSNQDSGLPAMAKEFSDSGVPAKESRILASWYQEASRKLQRIVLHPPGRTQASREYRAAWASQQVGRIDAILRELKGRASGWIGRRMPQAYRDGLALADRQATEAGVRVPGSGLAGGFAVIDERTITILARDAYADLEKAADSMGDRSRRLLRTTAQEGLSEADINRILAGGAIEGRPLDTIRNLREELRRVHGDTVEITTRNGGTMNFEVGYYAEMVARTRTREATVLARHERLEELGLDLVAIVGRVSNNFCTAFLGQVFSLSGKSAKYPAYSRLPGGGPPFHPHCTKSTRPFVEELATDRQLSAAQGVGDASLLLGMDQTEAQRSYQDLQIRTQVEDRYKASTRSAS